MPSCLPSRGWTWCAPNCWPRSSTANGISRFSSFEQIRSEVQERLTFVFGQQYELLRTWLEEYRSQPVEPLDHFLRRLFGEILSQKGFGFHRNFDAARTAASLIESIQKFRQAMEASGDTSIDVGREYLAMLQDGVIAAQYLEAWQTAPAEAVLIAPAHTFLMMNQPATVQFWLDVGSGGWWERLFQPLTQPYVLSRAWELRRSAACGPMQTTWPPTSRPSAAW